MKKQHKPKPEYELKHRLIGAAMLIFPAVLIIPLFLKEPAIEASVASVSSINLTPVIEEDSFISRIEPLLNTDDGLTKIIKNGAGVKGKIEGKSEGKEDAVEPAAVSQNSSEDEPELKTELQSVSQAASNEQQQQQVTTTDTQTPEENENNGAASDQSVATEASAVLVGEWTVRVGTFSKSANVDSISKLLNDSGLKAKYTEVETTLGKATRIWLGPYEKKETAEKVSTRLKKLIGEKGYVTKTT